MIDDIGRVIASIGTATGPELWVKVIGGVLIPLILLFMYFWAKGRAAKEAEELAKKNSDQKDREDRQETRQENDDENELLKKGSGTAATQKADAKKNFP